MILPSPTAEPRVFLEALARAAVAAASPAGAFTGILPAPPKSGRTIVLGAGKAAASMARAFEEAWPHPLEGLVVTRYGHACPTRAIEVIEASHPVPDENGRRAAERILALAESATVDDLVIALISGGASALLVAPAPGIALDEKIAISRALLNSGASIHEMNIVRRAISAIKGGRLAAAAAPARVVTFLISDVPGDDPATIGSGPTIRIDEAPDAALAILRRYDIAISDAVYRAIVANMRPDITPGAVHLLSSGLTVLARAGDIAREAGLNVLNLGDSIEGEAREVAKVMGGIARSCHTSGVPLSRPALILSGGECTVTVTGRGRGGRNAEFLLALALALDGAAGIYALAMDTDGIDGIEDNAGALIGPETLSRARAAGLDARAMLANNDAYSFFATLGDLVVTGPTLTNVNDFRALLVI